jgi:hypothetical protein
MPASRQIPWRGAPDRAGREPRRLCHPVIRQRPSTRAASSRRTALNGLSCGANAPCPVACDAASISARNVVTRLWCGCSSDVR